VDVISQLLGVNAPARLVVQLREDNLQAPGATKKRLQFFLHGCELALQLSSLIQDFWSFEQCGPHVSDLHKIPLKPAENPGDLG
jgi:hypothetical protein